MKKSKGNTITLSTGYIRDAKDARDFQYDAQCAKGSGALKATVDLSPLLAPIWAQTVCSCVPHAVAGMASRFDLTHKRDPSRMFLYFNSRLLEMTYKNDVGCMPRDCLKAAAMFGLCESSLWSEDPSLVLESPSKAAYTNALKWKADKYYAMNHGLVAMRRCLSDGYCFVFGMSLYDSYLDAATTGEVLMPKKKGDTYRGEHGVCAIGYNHKRRKFLIRNSSKYGTAWGINGHFWLPYEYLGNVNLTNDIWTLRSMIAA